jgi:hypothetical protein
MGAMEKSTQNLGLFIKGLVPRSSSHLPQYLTLGGTKLAPTTGRREEQQQNTCAHSLASTTFLARRVRSTVTAALSRFAGSMAATSGPTWWPTAMLGPMEPLLGLVDLVHGMAASDATVFFGVSR